MKKDKKAREVREMMEETPCEEENKGGNEGVEGVISGRGSD